MKVYKCKYFNYQYDDLGSYHYCESNKIKSGFCINPTGTFFAQQFCPCFQRGDELEYNPTDDELKNSKQAIEKAYYEKERICPYCGGRV